MFRTIVLAALIICCMACNKREQSVGCPAGPCTLLFATIGVKFTDKNGNTIAVQNLTAVNQRTKLSVLPADQHGINEPGHYVITDDSAREKLSTEGDEVLVSATNPATGQTKTVSFKLSGGCNCHVGRVSGPQVISFD